MASTITAKTLKITINESIKLNGTEQGSTNTFNIASISSIYKRIVTVPASTDTTIAVFISTTGVADSAFDIDNVRYIRVTNLDDTNGVNLSVQIDTGEDDSGSDQSFTHQLDPGRSFLLGEPHDKTAVDDDSGGIVTTKHDIESILVDSGSSDVDVEIFIASL